MTFGGLCARSVLGGLASLTLHWEATSGVVFGIFNTWNTKVGVLVVMVARLSGGPGMTTTGGAVSITKLRLACPMFPASSVAVTVTVCGPSETNALKGSVNGDTQGLSAKPSK